MTANLAELSRLVAAIETELAAIDARAGRYQDDPHGWRYRHHQGLAALRMRMTDEHGGAIWQDGWDMHVRLCGCIASGGTLRGAIEKWIIVARVALLDAQKVPA